jgi:hypothetical protein
VNNGSTVVRVMFENSQVEEASGARRMPRGGPDVHWGWWGAGPRVPWRDIGPGHDVKFELEFGEKEAPLDGNAFRLYLNVVQADGSGVIEGLPVVLLEAAPGTTFAKDVKRFSK